MHRLLRPKQAMDAVNEQLLEPTRDPRVDEQTYLNPFCAKGTEYDPNKVSAPKKDTLAYLRVAESVANSLDLLGRIAPEGSNLKLYGQAAGGDLRGFLRDAEGFEKNRLLKRADLRGDQYLLLANAIVEALTVLASIAPQGSEIQVFAEAGHRDMADFIREAKGGRVATTINPPRFRGSVKMAENPAGQYKYLGRCVELNGDSITHMTDAAQDVTLREITRNCQGLAQWSKKMGYGRGSGLTLAKDWHVSYGKSRYQGIPCYYIDHSSIEHVWTLNGEEGDPSVNEDAGEDDTKLASKRADDKPGENFLEGATPWQQLEAKGFRLSKSDAAAFRHRSLAADEALTSLREALRHIGQDQWGTKEIEKTIRVLEGYALPIAAVKVIPDRAPIFSSKRADIEMHETPKFLPPRNDMRSYLDEDVKKEMKQDEEPPSAAPKPEAKPSKDPWQSRDPDYMRCTKCNRSGPMTRTRNCDQCAGTGWEHDPGGRGGSRGVKVEKPRPARSDGLLQQGWPAGRRRAEPGRNGLPAF